MAKESRKLIANNKKAFHDYFIEDTWEAICGNARDYTLIDISNMTAHILCFFKLICLTLRFVCPPFELAGAVTDAWKDMLIMFLA